MISVRVAEASQVAEARRRAVSVAQASGLDEVATGRVAIVATELATNIVKYGGPGEILIGPFEDASGSGVEMIGLDKGPGMADVRESQRDGHSTGGSAGTGLGAIRRLSQASDIASWPGRGTAVLSRLQASQAGGEAETPLIGAVAVPLAGEAICGDAYCSRPHASGWLIIVADGLGHGPNAAQAADEAVRLFRANEDKSPGAILELLHAGLRHTRGAAVSISRLDRDRGSMVFAGVGNVSGAVVTGRDVARTVSQVGTVGLVARRIQEFEYPFSPDSLLVMHSDGVASNWSLESYPGLAAAHPSLIAAVLYRDFARARDDATVLVASGGRAS